MFMSRQCPLIRVAALLITVIIACAPLTLPAQQRRHRQGRSQARSDRAADTESRINALLARMTLEEKLGQLQQLDGEGNGNFRPEHLELIRKGLLGSTLNVRGAQLTNQLPHIV